MLLASRGHDTRKGKFLMLPHATTDLPTIKYCECGCGQPAPIAKVTDRQRGWTRGMPLRFIQGHRSRIQVYQRASLADRFRKFVEPRDPDECWLWQGKLDDDGYGHINFDSKRMGAHRVAYELLVGPIGEGMLICHSCDNRACCNPAHLFRGTPDDNSKDMVSKGRSACGSKQARAKLSEADIPVIRELCANGALFADVAAIYGVSNTAIISIVRRRTWKHVP